MPSRSLRRRTRTRGPTQPLSRLPRNARQSCAFDSRRGLMACRISCLLPSPLNAGLATLADQVPLKLRNAAHDREHEAAHLVGGVAVAKGNKSAIPVLELGHDVQQIPSRASTARSSCLSTMIARPWRWPDTSREGPSKTRSAGKGLSSGSFHLSR